MKIPHKQIFICGKWWTINIDNKLEEVGVTYDNNTISINASMCSCKQSWEDTLLHELLEAVLMASGASYDQSYGKEYLYCFDHDKFRNQIVPEILSIIKQLNFGGWKYGNKKTHERKGKVRRVQSGRKEGEVKTTETAFTNKRFLKPY